MLKKAVIVTGCAIMALAFTFGVPALVNWINRPEIGIADLTQNINVSLERAGDWRQVAGKAIIKEEDMGMIDGSTATVPITAELLRQFFGYDDEDVRRSYYIKHTTTHNAYINLINGTSRYGSDKEISLLFATPPSEEELKLARDYGLELDVVKIALDGFVFITHADNPVDSLTVEQVRGIYTGKIKNWKEVGGRDEKIRAYQREKNSGSQTAMEQIVMQGKKMISARKVLDRNSMYYTMGALVEAVAEYENGPASIGYTYNYYINNLYKNENIKVLRIGGIEPSHENLLSGAYPFTAGYCAVIRTDEPAGSPARLLRDYLLTPEGQEIIRLAGYCGAVN